jgi:hypothetical protein
MKKLIFGLIIILSLIGVSCTSVNGIDRSSDDILMHPPPSLDERPLQVKGVPVEDDYLPGQTVEIEIQFTNNSKDIITISQFPPEVRMISREWNTVDSFEAGSEEIQLKPGNKKTFNLTWDQREEAGRQVSSGRYRADVGFIGYICGDSQQASRISFSTGWFHILYPQGVVEKTVELNSSQTVNGVTVILENAEFSTKGTIFNCFAVQPEGLTIEPSPGYAMYSFDGITRDADQAGEGSGENGYRLIWGSEELPLDPIPSGTREVIFKITRLNDIEGPWEFIIPLE